ncbi:MAG: hypothetical protein EOO09_14240 [Chitinophagaceae bacterium]|nr:MAG: hypothetical protein EOO09_14240 [Chitinophagaceae bacterium]
MRTTGAGKILLFLLVFTINGEGLLAQEKREPWLKRRWNKLFHDTTSASASSFTYYPTAAYAPETGVEIGISALQLFRAKKDSTNRLSEIQAFAFVTFNSQYGLWLDNAIYGDKDKWFFLGRTRFQRFPLFYYGIGPDAKKDNHAVVESFNVTARQRVLRKVYKNLFLGPEVDYQLLSDVGFEQPAQGPGFVLPTGSDGTINLGFGAALVYDNRHNVLNVRKGLFAELGFLGYTPGLLSEHRFSSVNVELRSFHPVGKTNVLAWQFVGTFMNGDVPFNQLALVGGDMLMRGYYQGRYRDRNLLAGQVEYRMLPFSFSKRFGAVVFGGASVVAPRIRNFGISNLRFSGGAGLRYLLFPRKDIYIRLDIGFTQESSSFYVFNGEAF